MACAVDIMGREIHRGKYHAFENCMSHWCNLAPFQSKQIKILVVRNAILIQNCWVTVLGFFEQKREIHVVGVRIISRKLD